MGDKCFLRMSAIGKPYCIVEGKESALSWDESHPCHESSGPVQSEFLHKQFAHLIIMSWGLCSVFLKDEMYYKDTASAL